MDRLKTDRKRTDDGVGTRGMEDLVLQVRGRSLAGSKEFISEESYESEKKTTPETGTGRCVIQKFIMYPDNSFRRLWTAMVVGLLVYTGTVFIYRLIFVRFYVPRELEVPRFWNYFDRMVDVMFVMDLLIQFLFTYTSEKGYEVGLPRKIAIRYLSGWFWVNAISCVPEEVASAVYASLTNDAGGSTATGGHRSLRLVRMQRMTKIVRMLRLVKLTQLTERLNLDMYIQRYKVVAVLNTLCGLIWAVHVMACGWYLCAALHNDPLETWLARRLVGVNEEMLLNCSPFDQWAHSMYFVFAVFTTVGFGDISAFTTGEIMYVTLTMMVGAIVHSLIVGQVIGEVTSDNTVNTFLKNKLKLAKEFAAHANLDAAGAKALSFWLEQNARDLMTEQFKMDEMHQLVANDMPLTLMKELQGRLFQGQLARNVFLHIPFVVTPPRLPLLLSLVLMPKSYESGQLLYQAGDSAFHMYLVLSGTFAFVARPERPSKSPRANEMWPYQLFSHRSYFGNFELHGGLKQFRRATARCESDRGHALRLPREHYMRLCAEFPQFNAAWHGESIRREALRCRLQAAHGRMLNYRVLAAKRLQRYIRLRKAEKEALRGNEEEFAAFPSGRHSWHSSSGDVSDLGSLSLGSMAPQRSENLTLNTCKRATTRKTTDWKTKASVKVDEEVWKQQLAVSMSALKANADMQAEAIEGLRQEMRQVMAMVATLGSSFPIFGLRHIIRGVTTTKTKIWGEAAMARSCPFGSREVSMCVKEKPGAASSVSMFIALLLFVPAIGQDTTTTIPLTSLYSPDVSQNCPLQGNFPNRGLCVSVPQMGGTQCWDVCNPSHNASDYMVAGGGQIDVMNFVASVRPLAYSVRDACPKNLRHQFKVPYGRGLCVVKGDEKHGFACFDMCDYRIPASRFSEGAHQGIALQVMNFRSSGACQNKPWLPWVIALLFLFLIAGCFGLYYRPLA
eukprot:s912_g18.t1